VPPLSVVGLELIHGRCGRVDTSGGDRLKECIDHCLVEPQPADRLADRAGRLRLIRALAQVCVGATVRAGVLHLHLAPALSAPDQALQQR